MPLDTTTQHHLEVLKLAVESKHLGLKSISDATGVHISQVSRILSGKIKRVSPNVERICKFAKLADLPQDSNGSEEILWKTVKDVWDGTNEHAMALANLLSAIDRYQMAIHKPKNKISSGT